MNKHLIVTFLVTGTVIGLLVTWHFRQNILTISRFPPDEIESRDEVLQIFRDDQNYLQERIKILRGQIDEEEQSTTLRSQAANIEMLNQLRDKVGISEKSGKGVEIVLDDSPFVQRQGAEATASDIIQASDLRDVVNLLNLAHAEAISINNQRLIATSPIISVGTTVLVNNAHMAPPFTIRAIGDLNAFTQYLSNKDMLSSLYQRKEKFKLIFKFTAKEKISVPVFASDIKTSYLNLVE